MTGQMSLADLLPAEPPPERPCMHLEEWRGHPFCYLWQTYRVRGEVCARGGGSGCDVRRWMRGDQ